MKPDPKYNCVYFDCEYIAKNIFTAFKNYDWSEKDNETINGGGQTEDLLKKTCESHAGFVFTKGDDSKARGCGKGWCCQPSNEGNYKLSMIRNRLIVS